MIIKSKRYKLQTTMWHVTSPRLQFIEMDEVHRVEQLRRKERAESELLKGWLAVRNVLHALMHARGRVFLGDKVREERGELLWRANNVLSSVTKAICHFSRAIVAHFDKNLRERVVSWCPRYVKFPKNPNYERILLDLRLNFVKIWSIINISLRILRG